MASNGYTPTHKRILKVLEDGQRHHRDEVIGCLYDELTRPEMIWQYIASLRKKLLPERDIVPSRIDGQVYYFLVDVPPASNLVSK